MKEERGKERIVWCLKVGYREVKVGKKCLYRVD